MGQYMSPSLYHIFHLYYSNSISGFLRISLYTLVCFDPADTRMMEKRKIYERKGSSRNSAHYLCFGTPEI